MVRLVFVGPPEHLARLGDNVIDSGDGYSGVPYAIHRLLPQQGDPEPTRTMLGYVGRYFEVMSGDLDGVVTVGLARESPVNKWLRSHSLPVASLDGPYTRSGVESVVARELRTVRAGT